MAAGCRQCGLDLRSHDSGDGPAVFVILLLGAVMVPLALALEVLASPPLWLHALIWAPVILAASIVMLRVLKAFLIAQQYRHKSGEAGFHELS